MFGAAPLVCQTVEVHLNRRCWDALTAQKEKESATDNIKNIKNRQLDRELQPSLCLEKKKIHCGENTGITAPSGTRDPEFHIWGEVAEGELELTVFTMQCHIA